MSNDFVYVTYIYSTPQKVWDAITKPQFARRYWTHENHSDWKPGSRWEHRHHDGSGTVLVTGTILESHPPTRLTMTWERPNDPTRASRVTFEIEDRKPGLVCLTVTHDRLEDDDAMASSIAGGWPKVLSNLKSFLETGNVEPISQAWYPDTNRVDPLRNPRSVQSH